jgi:hypothetical protein
LFFRFLAIFLAEFLNPPGGVNNLLFACIERVTERTHFNMKGFTHGGTGLECIAATARHGDFLIVWMNFWFHGLILDLIRSADCETERRILSINPEGVATVRLLRGDTW